MKELNNNKLKNKIIRFRKEIKLCQAHTVNVCNCIETDKLYKIKRNVWYERGFCLEKDRIVLVLQKKTRPDPYRNRIIVSTLLLVPNISRQLLWVDDFPPDALQLISSSSQEFSKHQG